MPAAWQSVIDAVYIYVNKVGFTHQEINKGKELCCKERKEILKIILKGTPE